MMVNYYRIKEDTGQAWIIDDEGNPIEPSTARFTISNLQKTLSSYTYVYFGVNYEGEYKIGISIDPYRRSSELNLRLAFTYPCYSWGKYSAKNVESLIHTILTDLGTHLHGEWFSLSKYDLLLWSTFVNKRDPDLPIYYGRNLDSILNILETIKTVKSRNLNMSFDEYQLIFRLRYPVVVS